MRWEIPDHAWLRLFTEMSKPRFPQKRQRSRENRQKNYFLVGGANTKKLLHNAQIRGGE
jgi:hypothetical protein